MISKGLRIAAGALLAGVAIVIAAPPQPAAATTCDDHPNQASAQRAKHTRDTDGDGLLDEDGTDGLFVTIAIDPSQDRRDRYGRPLAHVEASHSGVDVAKRQLRAGWATVYVFDAPFQRHRPYNRVAPTARGDDRGVWGACGGNFHKGA